MKYVFLSKRICLSVQMKYVFLSKNERCQS